MITNTCKMGSTLNIAINTLPSTTMSLSALKTSIKTTGDYATPTLLTNLDSNTLYDTNKYISSYVIKEDTLYAGETKEYSILLWMDKEATNEEMGKIFNAKIVITNVADPPEEPRNRLTFCFKPVFIRVY